MEVQEISSVRLEGVYASLPAKAVDNAFSLREIYSDKAESIVKATGIEKRFFHVLRQKIRRRIFSIHLER